MAQSVPQTRVNDELWTYLESTAFEKLGDMLPQFDAKAPVRSGMRRSIWSNDILSGNEILHLRREDRDQCTAWREDVVCCVLGVRVCNVVVNDFDRLVGDGFHVVCEGG